MEENLNESQRQALMNKRKEMFAKMGVSKAGTMINESVVANGGANSSMAAKLAAIKNGSAKGELNKYIQATSKGSSNGTAGFQGLPEPKMKKNPNQEQVKPEYKQKLEDFGGPSSAVNSELDMIDSMFDGGASSRSFSTGEFKQNPVSMDLNIDNISMPTFNPQAALQNKMREKQAQNQDRENQYLKFANPNTQVHEEFEPAQINQQHVNPASQLNMQALQNMMEKIAKGIAEKTIKNVLNEYSEQQKTKNYFEYYNKEKGIIRTPDGKLYKLTQVQLRQK